MFGASMQFDHGEDINALREAVHKWAQERVRPIAQDIDAKKTSFLPSSGARWAISGCLA